MIWFLFKMIYRLATLAALALIGYLIYAAVTGQQIGAEELSKNVEKVEFEDGGYATVQVSGSWCPTSEMMKGTFAKLQKSAGGRSILGAIYNSKCDLINEENYKDIEFFMAMPLEFPAQFPCKGRKTNTYNLNSPAGDANSCIMEMEESKSGYLALINYPVPNQRTLQFMVDAQLWKDKHKEILDMIKTTKYVGAAQ